MSCHIGKVLPRGQSQDIYRSATILYTYIIDGSSEVIFNLLKAIDEVFILDRVRFYCPIFIAGECKQLN